MPKILSKAVDLLTFSDYAIKLLIWIFIGGAGGAFAYLAHLTEPLAFYKPISWAIAGSLGALVLTLALAAGGFAYRNIEEARLARALSIEPKTINPLADKFNNQTIKLTDFYSPLDLEYTDKTFTDCDIIGPGTIIFFRNTQLIKPEMVNCDFVAVPPGMLQTGIAFNDTIFLRCRFYKILFLLPEPLASQLHSSTSGKLNWLVRPDQLRSG